ncbi:TetR/AcrR family transcriptional regulator [Leekyejoonella antrihumi]|uniref:TetR/AcrR family transcriptional regulator n=1 Tax=Leekyejoonella antrihumi TaxID=1660198 RepID=UPI001C95585C|nr:TetR/AcrR family transcriptional regulator [Leekyejoonella antrihumi]
MSSAPSPRIERKRDKRVQEIVRTAADLFAERGYDAVSLDDVAERLDVTKGSLYYYFAGKDELCTAALETLGNGWMERLEELSAAYDGSDVGRLRALLHEHIMIAVRDYPAALRLFLVPREWPASQARSIKAMRTRHDAIFRDVIDSGVRAGEFDAISTDVTLQCMHAAMTQAPTWCGRLTGRARTRAIDELTDTLMLLVGCSRADD